MKKRVLHLVCVLSLAFTCRAVTPQPNLSAQQLLGYCELDGTLRMRVLLIDRTPIGTSCSVRHVINNTALGGAMSGWIFDGICTYISPNGRDSLAWHSPFGLTVDFNWPKLSNMADVGEARAAGFTMKRLGPNTYEISNLAGAWQYVDGALRAFRNAKGERFTVSSTGGLIDTISTSIGDVVMAVHYDADRRPIEISMLGQTRAKFEWVKDELHHIDSVRSVSIEYIDRLISNFTIGGQRNLVEWSENHGALRGDSKWPARIHVSKVGTRIYGFGLSPRGWIIEVRDDKGTWLGEIATNPLTQRVSWRMRS